jgi:hypothetical protein
VFIALADGRALRGDLVLKAEQRFDLTVIPSTLELTLAADSKLSAQVVEGAIVIAGSGADRYTVLKARRVVNPQAQDETTPREVVQVIAALEGLTPLAVPLPRAVVNEGRSMGQIYRACGAQVRVEQDIPTVRFTCFAGSYATNSIAQLMQEEGAAPVWSSGRISFTRYVDLFAAKPKYSVVQDVSRKVESKFLEAHEVPRAISNSSAGAVISGPGNLQRPVIYMPRQPLRVLTNFGRYIAVRREMSIGYEGSLRAGDVIELSGVKYVIVTAVHLWETGAGGNGENQITRLWLGQLQGLVL